MEGVRSSKVERSGENGEAGGSIPSEPTYAASDMNTVQYSRWTKATKYPQYLQSCKRCRGPFFFTRATLNSQSVAEREGFCSAACHTLESEERLRCYRLGDCWDDEKHKRHAD